MSRMPMRSFTAAAVAALLTGGFAAGLAVATATEATGAGQAELPIGEAGGHPVLAVAGDDDVLIERLAIGFPLELRIAQPGKPTEATMMSMAIVP